MSTTAQTTAAPEAAEPRWQAQIAAELDSLATDPGPEYQHLIVGIRAGGKAELLDLVDNEADAITKAARIAASDDEYEEVNVTTRAAVAEAAETAPEYESDRVTIVDADGVAEEDELVEDGEPKDGLFDKSQYNDPKLYLDKVDEKDVDKIRVDFSGSVMLDRRNPRDVEFMRQLALGKKVQLDVLTVCSSKKHGYTTGKEGDLDAIVFTGGLKVDSITWPKAA
jgi:hypothetical protein